MQRVQLLSRHIPQLKVDVHVRRSNWDLLTYFTAHGFGFQFQSHAVHLSRSTAALFICCALYCTVTVCFSDWQWNDPPTSQQIVLTPRSQQRPPSVTQQHPPLGGQVALSLLSWVEWLVYWCSWCYWWWLCLCWLCVFLQGGGDPLINGTLRSYLNKRAVREWWSVVHTALGLVSVCLQN